MIEFYFDMLLVILLIATIGVGYIIYIKGKKKNNINPSGSIGIEYETPKEPAPLREPLISFLKVFYKNRKLFKFERGEVTFRGEIVANYSNYTSRHYLDHVVRILRGGYVHLIGIDLTYEEQQYLLLTINGYYNKRINRLERIKEIRKERLEEVKREELAKKFRGGL